MGLFRNNARLKERRRELRKNMTDAERLLWERVRNNQIEGERFFRQYSVGPYIIDFYCPKLRLVIELDGGQHSEEDSKEYDEGRTRYLNGQGMEVLRF